MNALEKTRQMLDTRDLLDKAEKIIPKFEAIAAEKSPGTDPQETIPQMFAEVMKDIPLATDTYEAVLNRMATDLGHDNFIALRANPNFQTIFEKWKSDYTERKFNKMLEDVVAWSGNRLTVDEIKVIFQISQNAEELQRISRALHV